VSRQLEGLGLTHNSYYDPMLRRLAGSGDIHSLRTLADVVEPVKEYAREEQAVTQATSFTPLNRLVDAAHPESDKARKFSIMVDAYLAGNADAATKATMRQWLILWRDNDAAIQPVIAASFLLQEDAALSRKLSALGSAGLQAMDYTEGNQHPANDWAAQEAAALVDASKPSAQLLLMVAPSVQRLVTAAVTQSEPAK
jgi:hexosaminidase